MKATITPIIISSDEEDEKNPPASKGASSSSGQLLENQVKGEEKEEDNEDGTNMSSIKIEVKPNVLLLRNQITNTDISNMIVKCSSCGNQMNHHDPHRLRIHPNLKVLICKDCLEFYGNGEFSQDDEGDKYCRWCAQGGRLYGCDFCSNVFCVDCIHRNFGRGESRRVKEDQWKCYMCDPSKLLEKVNFCEMIMDYSKTKQRNKTKKRNLNFAPCSIEQLQLVSDIPSEWLPKAFDCLKTSSSKFNYRIDKLIDSVSKGRSSIEIVSKLEKVMDCHKAEMKGVMENINEKFMQYKKERLSEHMKNSVVNNCGESKPVINSSNRTVNHATPEKAARPLSKRIKLFDLDSALEDVSQKNNSETSAKEKAVKECELNDSCDLFEEPVIQEKSEQVTEKSSNIEDINISDHETIIPNSEIPHEENLESDVNTADSCLNNDDNNNDDTNVDHNDDNNDKNEVSLENDAAKKLLLQSLESDESDTSTIPDSQTKTRVEESSDSSLLQNSDGDDDSKRDSANASDSHKKKLKKKSKSRRSRKKENSYFFSRDETKSLKDYPNDKKLNSKPVVVLTRLALSIPVPEVISPDKPESSEEDELSLLKKSVDKLLKLPTSTNKRTRESSDSSGDKIPTPPVKKQKKRTTPMKEKPRKISTPDSWTLSSGDDMETEIMPATKIDSNLAVKTFNDESKKILLEGMDGSSSEKDVFSDSSGSERNISKKRKPNNKNTESDDDKDACPPPKDSSDDSDDFVLQKPKKGDRLLNVPLIKNNRDKSDDKASDKKEKKAAKENKRKRKSRMLYSDDSDADSQKSDSSSTSSSSDSSSRKKKNKKKRRRIKTADDSSDEDKQKEKGTPKGRKNIRKVISDKKLTQSTLEAQEEEKERRKRVAERQKLYNKITEASSDGLSTVTTKMVLEVDQDSKEEVVEIQDDLITKLKPHQVNGVKFMWEATIESIKLLNKPGSGCILAHCMGLGKTLQVITFLHTILTNKHVKKKIRTALVICPYNTVLNWSSEFRKWLEDIDNEINVFDLNWDKSNYDRRDRLETWMSEGGVMVLGYNMFTRLAEGKLGKCPKKVKEAIMRSLVEPGPDIVVCDEGHMLKNENSALSKAANKLKTARRIVLTGTPLQNNLKEYHCMMHFVKPNLLGTAKEFANRFANPISNGQYDNSSQHDVKKMKKRVHILHKLLEGCVQRCDYSALTKYLPPKHEFVISVQLSEVQVKLYKQYLETFSQNNAADKIDGRNLFHDYKILKLIWTYPYLLYDDYYRQERLKLNKFDDEEEEEFINDKSSGESSNDEEKAGNNKKSDESSEEEVVRSYRTRSRAADGEANSDEDSREPEAVQHWFSPHIVEDEDQFKIEMSGKMVLLLDILKQCESIGDKVLLFSTSLLTLNLIEDVLQNLSVQSDQNKSDGNKSDENEPDENKPDENKPDENKPDENEPDEKKPKENKTFEIPDTLNKWVPNLDYFRMDGSTAADLRRKWIDAFNDTEDIRARLFLISTKAGSLGTNLVGANRVILMDASWNPSHDVQAIFRVYRFGQTKPVYVYRLLAQGTMEEKIYNRQVTKLSLSCRVVDEQQIDRHFNPSDLQELYTLEIPTEKPTPMVPNDRLLADILINRKNWIYKYHEHDSLLQSANEVDLTEEERQAAWTEYENEKEGILPETEAMNNTFANIDTLINIDIKVVVNNWILELKRKGSNVAVLSSVIGQANAFRSQLQTKHTVVLRTKKLYISRNDPVPQQILDWQYKLQADLETVSQFITQITMILPKGAPQQPPRQAFYRPQQQTFANYGTASYGAPNFGTANYAAGNYTSANYGAANRASGVYYQVPPRFPYAPPPFVPPTNNPPEKTKPTIVDITADATSSPQSSAGTSSPIITEAEEVKSTKEDEKKPEKKHSYEITEID